MPIDSHLPQADPFSLVPTFKYCHKCYIYFTTVYIFTFRLCSVVRPLKMSSGIYSSVWLFLVLPYNVYSFRARIFKRLRSPGESIPRNRFQGIDSATYVVWRAGTSNRVCDSGASFLFEQNRSLVRQSQTVCISPPWP